MKKDEPNIQISIPDNFIQEWQNLVDIVATLLNIPAALIMRITESEIEVLVSSHSKGNPYQPGAKEHLFGSGLYCETVIKTNKKLLVPNALTDEKWKNNPDIKLNMISYLGFPILWPDKSPFGTICVLDTKENVYPERYLQMMEKFRGIIQTQLELVYTNHMLGEKNKSLIDYLAEIRTLRGIVPICSFCKKIRDDKGYWEEVESYITKHTNAKFSHGICHECAKKHYPDVYTRRSR